MVSFNKVVSEKPEVVLASTSQRWSLVRVMACYHLDANTTVTGDKPEIASPE
jgi:hypothetical protein